MLCEAEVNERRVGSERDMSCRKLCRIAFKGPRDWVEYCNLQALLQCGGSRDAVAPHDTRAILKGF